MAPVTESRDGRAHQGSGLVEGEHRVFIVVVSAIEVLGHCVLLGVVTCSIRPRRVREWPISCKVGKHHVHYDGATNKYGEVEGQHENYERARARLATNDHVGFSVVDRLRPGMV